MKLFLFFFFPVLLALNNVSAQKAYMVCTDDNVDLFIDTVSGKIVMEGQIYSIIKMKGKNIAGRVEGDSIVAHASWRSTKEQSEFEYDMVMRNFPAQYQDSLGNDIPFDSLPPDYRPDYAYWVRTTYQAKSDSIIFLNRRIIPYVDDNNRIPYGIDNVYDEKSVGGTGNFFNYVVDNKEAISRELIADSLFKEKDLKEDTEYGESHVTYAEKDIDGDGVKELLVLQDKLVFNPQRQYILSVFKKTRGAYHLLCRVEYENIVLSFISIIHFQGIKTDFLDIKGYYCQHDQYTECLNVHGFFPMLKGIDADGQEGTCLSY